MKIAMWRIFKILDIYKRVKELKISAKTAYKFNKLCISLDSDVEFYNKELNKIIQMYAERNEDGTVKQSPDGGVQIKADQIATAQGEIDTLWNLEADSPDIQFTVDELDELQLSIEDFNCMLPFIKE